MEFIIALIVLAVFDVLAMRFGADSRETELDSHAWPASVHAEI
ncbi:MAG: hypothetical protein ACJ78Q_05180 [Chloroflexia bacterium]|jgi:hypothetical protein